MNEPTLRYGCSVAASMSSKNSSLPMFVAAAFFLALISPYLRFAGDHDDQYIYISFLLINKHA